MKKEISFSDRTKNTDRVSEEIREKTGNGQPATTI